MITVDEKINELTLHVINNPSHIRVYPMKNGDIFKIYGMLLEFEDDTLHGVVAKEIYTYGGRGNQKLKSMGMTYVRTGINFTAKEINQVVKEIKQWGIKHV